MHLKKQIAAARKRGDYASVRRMEKIEMAEAQHPGFEVVAASIARRTDPHTGKPYGRARAEAILAARSRGASAAAKRKNPRLEKVK